MARSDKDRRSGTGSEPPGKGSISKRSKGASLGCAIAVLGVFLLVGLGFLSIFIVPLVRVVGARGWQRADCTIERSWVETHSSDDGSTYSVEARYSYEYEGRPYRGDRYQFLGGSSSGYDSKKRVVDAMPAGETVRCWVDPDEPAKSVIHRGLTWGYLFGLIPLVFVAVGAFGVWALWAMSRKEAGETATDSWLPKRPAAKPEGSPRSWLPKRLAAKAQGPIRSWLPERLVAKAEAPIRSWLPKKARETAAADSRVWTGPAELEPSLSPWNKFFLVTLLALFWNGITSIFVRRVYEGWTSGDSPWFMTLFITPFVLIGILLLTGVPYQFLATFNPRPKLALDNARVRLGDEAGLEWSFSGHAARLRRLTLKLVGTEEARYRRGTNTHTDREAFAEILLLDETSSLSIPRGRTGFTMPAGTMHSFEASNNKVVWKLSLHGDIARWPDVVYDYEIFVLPREVPA